MLYRILEYCYYQFSMSQELPDDEVIELSLASLHVAPREDLPVHTVEQVALSIMGSSVSAPHYDDGLLAELGEVRTEEFRESSDLRVLSERIDDLRFRCTTKLSLLMTDAEIARYVNDLDAARELDVDEYELCRTIKFLHDAGCALLHWV
ncbi:hypothetical protein KJ652_01065 [Patescibacteria group bacterium]|nr:hypothetical protein [Patescibacteria group bacterium]MBU1123160.1 hypothetical protein [Patescibacteria group bacterium]